ncbi:MAG: hypothetical protein LUE29_01295, partial [Lachnospiraceae bacterium]|nr:hypothetical protein [Lachnospiraceae bacterium]
LSYILTTGGGVTNLRKGNEKNGHFCRNAKHFAAFSHGFMNFRPLHQKGRMRIRNRTVLSE